MTRLAADIEEEKGPESGHRLQDKAETASERLHSLFSEAVREKAQHLGQSYLRKWRERRKFPDNIRRVPARMRMTARQLELVIELVEDFRKGSYKEVSWASLAVMTGALLYSISPADVIPDAIIGIGALDDAIVLSIAMRLVQGELKKYCTFKGYEFDNYFVEMSEQAEREERLEREERQVAHVA